MPTETLAELQEYFTLERAHRIAKEGWEQMLEVYRTGEPPLWKQQKENLDMTPEELEEEFGRKIGYKDLYEWSWDFFPTTLFHICREIDVCQWIWSQPEFEAVNQRITELAKIDPREMIIETFFPRNVPELFYCDFEMLLTEENISDESFARLFFPELWRPYIDEEANKKIVEGDKRRAETKK